LTENTWEFDRISEHRRNFEGTVCSREIHKVITKMVGNVLITGANRGIGLALASLILQNTSGKVILTARDSSKLKKAIELLNHDSTRVKGVTLDVSSDASVQALNVGKIDVLVNNAGVFNKSDNYSLEIAKSTLETNTYGVVRMIEKLADVLPVGGKVVNVGAYLGRLTYVKNPYLSEVMKGKSVSLG
jgi:NAD(P)-dependent dehydrogenase (short-subunit alcohol dehydrogenase family)